MNSLLTQCTPRTALMNDFSSRGEPLSPASFLVCQHPCLLPTIAQWLRLASRHFQGLPGVESGRRTQVTLSYARVHFDPTWCSSCSILGTAVSQHSKEASIQLPLFSSFPSNEFWLRFVNKGTATHLEPLVNRCSRVHSASDKEREETPELVLLSFTVWPGSKPRQTQGQTYSDFMLPVNTGWGQFLSRVFTWKTSFHLKTLSRRCAWRCASVAPTANALLGPAFPFLMPGEHYPSFCPSSCSTNTHCIYKT